MDLKQFEIDKDYIKNVYDNCSYNKLIIEYYRRYCIENGNTNTFKNKINSIGITIFNTISTIIFNT